jgi:hypothetical protein
LAAFRLTRQKLNPANFHKCSHHPPPLRLPLFPAHFKVYRL